MKQRFDREKYGQRWQVETVNSMIERRLGSPLRERGYWSQCREIILRAVTHNFFPEPQRNLKPYRLLRAV